MMWRALVLTFVTGLALTLVGLVTAVTANGGGISVYGTYLGGELPDYGNDIAVDANGNVYLVGRTESLDFPTGTVNLFGNHGIDVFVAKFNNDGSQAAYILWFYAQAFQAIDEGFDILVDEQGYAYVVGHTGSFDFCDLFGDVPGYRPDYIGAGDGFLLKVEPDGSGLVYCTFLGGTEYDNATAVALDAAGNVYVTGGTWSTDFFTSANTINDQHAGLRDTYLLAFDPTGTALLHASLIGGAGQEESRALALDDAGDVYLAGWTNSSDFLTTTGVISPVYSGNFDAFLVKIEPGTPALAYATYLGGTDEDRAYGLAIDSAGRPLLAGLTRSDNFPTTSGAFAETFAGGGDGFVARLNADASALAYATYLGGSGEDQINDIVLDEADQALATGQTWSSDFPTTTTAFSPTLTGGRSAFIAHLNATGSALLYGSYLGGNNWDTGNGIIQDAFGRVYVTGATRSTDFPVSANAFAITHTGDYDAFFSSVAITDSVPLLADFTAVPQAGFAPLTIQFSNLSTGPILSQTWHFGDGASSSEISPTHTYEQPGSYTVSLTVQSVDGSHTRNRENYIQVWWLTYLPLILRP